MKKYVSLFGIISVLAACDSKPDYVIPETASCDVNEENLETCKDTNGNNINGTAYKETENYTYKLKYRDGKRDGKQQYFYKNGKKYATVNFADGFVDGESIYYYENGNTKNKELYLHGKREGVSKYYDENGNIERELNFTNGIQMGPQKLYHKNGTMSRDLIMDEDGNQTDVKLYYENGVLQGTVEKIGENNKYSGLVKGFNESGTLVVEAMFENGKKVGIQKSYNDKGVLTSEATFKDDKQIENKVFEYDNNGNVLYTVTYDANNKETGIIYQDKKITRAQLDFELAVSDCEQAVQKATSVRKAMNKDDVAIFADARTITVNNDGLMVLTERSSVVDFANDGVFVAKYSTDRKFIYTKDTDYSTNEGFHGKYVYESAGNYKYTTMFGGANSVPAFRATSYKISEISPKTYLKNKELSCCQYVDLANDKGLGEVGIFKDKSYIDKHPYSAAGGYATGPCHTRNHPNGLYSTGYRVLSTGTDY